MAAAHKEIEPASPNSSFGPSSNLPTLTKASVIDDIELADDSKEHSYHTGELSGSTGDDKGSAVPVYRVYKKRWIGLVALFAINLVSAMNAQWFAAIVEQTAILLKTDLTKINWFANCCNLTSLVSYTFVPTLLRRYNVRTLATMAAVLNIIGSWVRYGGIQGSSNVSVQYGIVLFGQLINGFATPLALALGTKYAELWFPPQERTTATMLLTISNPFGMALASVISPAIVVEPTDVARSVLILACINFVHIVAVIVPSTPEIPPTHASALPPPTFSDGVRLFLGDKIQLPFLAPASQNDSAHRSKMTKRERIDLWIVLVEYTILVASLTSLQVEIASVFMPHGYSSSASGNFGGGMILAGIVGACVSAPLLDRFFKNHLAIAAKIVIPIVAFMNLALIFVTKPDNDIGIAAVLIVMGGASFSLLAIGMELGAEVSRQPEATASAFYWLSTLWTFCMTNIMDAARASDTANPPQNMRNALIIEVCFTMFAAALIFCLKGDQRRTREDRERLERQAAESSGSVKLETTK